MSNSDPSDFLQGLDVATTLTQTVPFGFHSNTASHGGFPEQFFGQAFSLWKEQGAEALKEEFNDLWLKAGQLWHMFKTAVCYHGSQMQN